MNILGFFDKHSPNGMCGFFEANFTGLLTHLSPQIPKPTIIYIKTDHEWTHCFFPDSIPWKKTLHPNLPTNNGLIVNLALPGIQTNSRLSRNAQIATLCILWQCIFQSVRTVYRYHRLPNPSTWIDANTLLPIINRYDPDTVAELKKIFRQIEYNGHTLTELTDTVLVSAWTGIAMTDTIAGKSDLNMAEILARLKISRATLTGH